ncbi:MAG: hypothetical protein U0L18_09095 [Acutalibacteraceae bacterium]|nr:hypothetical protein [Acutalibacteraceae bacterium]
MARNSDGSYDAVDSGGFGKDYHGQDAFGERIGGTGIGGSHFGGFEEGHVGLDKDNTGHYEKLSYGDITQTESMPKSAFEADNGNESEEEASSGMRDTLRDLNTESSEENSKVGSLDTSLQIGKNVEEEEDKEEKERLERYQKELDRLDETVKESEAEYNKELEDIDNDAKVLDDLIGAIAMSGNTAFLDGADNAGPGSKISKAAAEKAQQQSRYALVDTLYDVAKKNHYSKFSTLNKDQLKNGYFDGAENLPTFFKGLVNDIVKEAKTNSNVKHMNTVTYRDQVKERVAELENSIAEKTKSSFTDKMEESKEEAAANKGLEKVKEKYEAKIQEANETKKAAQDLIESIASLTENPFKTFINRSAINEMKSNIVESAKVYGLNLDPKGNIQDIVRQYTDAVRDKCNKDIDMANKALAAATEYPQRVQNATKEAKSNLDKYNSSFTDKMEESKEEAKAGPNMSKASVGESDYPTKANKDSTKKEGPSRNDFPNHAADTLKGVVDKIADNTTAKALGIQSLEDFAKEKGVDPNKFSTMKAYQSYQNKQIMKALPNIIKKVGSYITERIKDAFDPSQLPERIRNTLARYNAATLVGAAILSIQSGAGIQASIDQALTMVDPEDQPAVSDYLEDVLNDEGTVADLSNAFDDALAPEQTSDTAELDESIVNIGRKDNTDYSGFNAGLGTSGTTSDADVKVFIARNVKADPILRRMISKMGK